MKKHLRTLLVGISAPIALGTVSVCCGGKTGEATSTSEAVTTPPAKTATPFPHSARYIADMKAADGKTMTTGISVDGASIAAYACNGTDDEARFFGNQTDGKLDIKSRFHDTLKAEFTGSDVAGDLTMNGVAYTSTGRRSPARRACTPLISRVCARRGWFVRTDRRSAFSFNGGISGRDFEQADRPAREQIGTLQHQRP
ncbi:MAG: hypothetical protein V7643_4811 [Mycobacterium sp.]